VPPFSPRAEGAAVPPPAAHRVNGTTNGDRTNGDAQKHSNTEAGKVNEENKSKQPVAVETKAPSSNLKCLEDPNFSFDEAPSAGPTEKATAGSDPKKPLPSYRVLEDPELELPKARPGYKVLEDPMMTSIYKPAKPEPAKGRPEEVADGARQQFDKFFKGNQT
jgi:hypothetical protein